MHIPTPQEIRDACIAIQDKWTLDQRNLRIANDHWRARHFVAPTAHVSRRWRGVSDLD
jgi:hypothetical protein